MLPITKLWSRPTSSISLLLLSHNKISSAILEPAGNQSTRLLRFVPFRPHTCSDANHRGWSSGCTHTHTHTEKEMVSHLAQGKHWILLFLHKPSEFVLSLTSPSTEKHNYKCWEILKSHPRFRGMFSVSFDRDKTGTLLRQSALGGVHGVVSASISLRWSIYDQVGSQSTFQSLPPRSPAGYGAKHSSIQHRHNAQTCCTTAIKVVGCFLPPQLQQEGLASNLPGGKSEPLCPSPPQHTTHTKHVVHTQHTQHSALYTL